MSHEHEHLSRKQLIDELLRLHRQVRDNTHLQSAMAELRTYQEELRIQNEQLIEAQRQLEFSRDRYADLYDFAPVGYMTLDRNAVIGEINLTGARLLGLERSRLLGTPLIVYVHLDDREALLKHMRQCRQGNPTTSELRISTRDGRIVPVELASVTSAIGHPDETAIFRTTITDLTARKRLEDERRQGLEERHRLEYEREEAIVSEEAARAASNAKDRFLAILSHELRTPLAPVMVALMSLQEEGGLSQEAQDTLSMIHRNIKLEAALIEDLLDLTRIGHGKLQLRSETVDAHGSLHNAIEICRSAINSKQIELRLELNAQQHHVRADATRLQQVFWNLLNNAAKFTPDGGVITVRSTNAAQDLPSGAQRLLIEIQDTGIGIEPQMLPHVFDAFEQAQRKGEKYGGLGLGLTISRALMEAQGGHLTATSPGINRGATLVVEMPSVAVAVAAASAPSAMGKAAEQAEASKPLRILLVEDHADTARTMASLLRRHGHHVQIAAGVRDGYEASQREQFDMLISDIGLPDGTGTDLLRSLAAEGKRLPAIALSGYGTAADIEKSKAAGFAEHLVKPILNVREITGAVQRVASQS